MTPERLTELAQYNRLGRAGGFMTLIVPPTVEELDEVFVLAAAALLHPQPPVPETDLRAAAEAAITDFVFAYGSDYDRAQYPGVAWLDALLGEHLTTRYLDDAAARERDRIAAWAGEHADMGGDIQYFELMAFIKGEPDA